MPKVTLTPEAMRLLNEIEDTLQLQDEGGKEMVLDLAIAISHYLFAVIASDEHKLEFEVAGMQLNTYGAELLMFSEYAGVIGDIPLPRPYGSLEGPEGSTAEDTPADDGKILSFEDKKQQLKNTLEVSADAKMVLKKMASFLGFINTDHLLEEVLTVANGLAEILIVHPEMQVAMVVEHPTDDEKDVMVSYAGIHPLEFMRQRIIHIYH